MGSQGDRRCPSPGGEAPVLQRAPQVDTGVQDPAEEALWSPGGVNTEGGGATAQAFQGYVKEERAGQDREVTLQKLWPGMSQEAGSLKAGAVEQLLAKGKKKPSLKQGRRPPAPPASEVYA